MPVADRKWRFTADDYQRMAQTGILYEGARVELIDGEVLEMTPIGPRHNAAVSRANRALVTAAGEQAIVLPQGSVRLGPYHEPQPDLVLLRPRTDYYASRLAGPDDILLIIEVADSSLEYDRDIKARIYAQLGIREYWLVDLNAGVISIYSEPRDGAYRTIRPRRRGESIAPHMLPDCVLPVEALLAD